MDKKTTRIPRSLIILLLMLALCVGVMAMDRNATASSGTATVSWTDDAGIRHTANMMVQSSTGAAISGARVSVNGDGGFTVILPNTMTLQSDPVPVTVQDSNGVPQEGIRMTVDAQNRQGTGKTDADGKIMIPAAPAYIYGYPDGSFRPEDGLTRGEAATIFARLLSSKKGDSLPAESDTVFSDVLADSWCSGAVSYLYDSGILSNGARFSPESAITRGEFVSMAVRWYACYSGTDEAHCVGKCPFPDVDSQNTYHDAICQAAQREWVFGYADDSFGGDSAITRAEAVTVVNRILGYGKAKQRTTAFTDISKSHWAYGDVLAAAGDINAESSK